MGTFGGHFLPGAFFFTIGLWWTTQICKRYLICRKKDIPFYSTVTFQCGYGRCTSLPLEGIFKITATSIGMFLELLASTDWGSGGGIVFLGDIQHVTMYMGFFVSGVTDVLIYKQVEFIPPGADYFAPSLAFFAEFLLFKYHLHGRDDLDILIHTLLLYVIVGCACVILLEYKYQKNVLVSYSRAYLTMLQGTWFIQVGFILYPPLPILTHWDSSEHDNLMLVVLMFIWHCVGLLFVIGIITGVLSFVCRKRLKRGNLAYDMTGANTAEPRQYRPNGKALYRPLDNDSESETEFSMTDISNRCQGPGNDVGRSHERLMSDH